MSRTHPHTKALLGVATATFALVWSCRADASSPYSDTKGRFRIELAHGWALAPRFGDTHGMVFERAFRFEKHSSVATLSIHAYDMEGDRLRESVAATDERPDADPEIRRTRTSRSRVGRHDAASTEYRRQPSRSDAARDIRIHRFDAHERRFFVRLECDARDCERVRADVEAMLASFVSLEGTTTNSTTPKEDRSHMLGRWIGPTGAMLLLRQGGEFELGDARGRFTASGGKLSLARGSGATHVFAYTIDDGGEVLTLRSSALREPAIYRRARTEAAPPVDSPADVVPTPERLAGTWTRRTDDRTVTLVLDANGSFSLDRVSGRWTLASGGLRLERTATETITYSGRCTHDGLVLWGGDLDDPIRFARAK